MNLDEAVARHYPKRPVYAGATKMRKRFGIAAFRKGWMAAMSGIKREANPYPDYRTGGGQVTFSRAYRRHWFKGYDVAIRNHQRAMAKRNVRFYPVERKKKDDSDFESDPGDL